MTGTSMPPVSTSRPAQKDFGEPEPSALRKAFEKVMAKLHAMSPEERLEYWIGIGACHPDGTPKLPEGEPIGMPYPGDCHK